MVRMGFIHFVGKHYTLYMYIRHNNNIAGCTNPWGNRQTHKKGKKEPKETVEMKKNENKYDIVLNLQGHR